jgi:hypothetical protein
MRASHSTLLLLSLTAGLACKGERTDDQAVQTTTAEGRLASPSGETADKRGVSMVRMINALPTVNAATVTADDKAMFSSVDYKSVTPYTEITDNIARFRLQGGTRDTTIASNNEFMMDGSRYTMVALPEKDGGVRLRVLHDELATDAGKARLRVIHGVAGVDEIDVLLQGSTDPLFDDVNLTSEAGYKDIDPAKTTLLVREDGSNRQLVKKEMNFQAGHSYTVVVTSNTKGQRVDAIVVDDHVMNQPGTMDSTGSKK